MTVPRVSIITTTYNRSAYLAEAVESVLAQTIPDWELLIIDDGSTDGTRAMVARFAATDPRIHYVAQSNQGLSRSRAYGVTLARAGYLAFLDDDDRYLPRKLEWQVEFLDTHPEVGLVYSYVDLVDANARFLRCFPTTPVVSFLGLLQECTIASHAVLVRRRCLEELGGFRPELLTANDYDMWLRLSRRFPIAFLPGHVGLYRKHAASLTATGVLPEHEAYLQIYQDLLMQGGLSAQEHDAVVAAADRTRRDYARRTYNQAGDALGSGRLREAVSCLAAAVRKDPFIGAHMPWGRFDNALYRLLRPYGALVYYGARSLWQDEQIAVSSPNGHARTVR